MDAPEGWPGGDGGRATMVAEPGGEDVTSGVLMQKAIGEGGSGCFNGITLS